MLMHDIPDWLFNSMQTEITVWSTTMNGNKIQAFLKAKKKEGFDRIETSSEATNSGMMIFKIKLIKLEPFEIAENI